MLSTIEVVIFSAVLLLVPVTVYSLFTGNLPPENMWLARYYRAEKYLLLVGNIFVLSICLMAAGKLAVHFGLVDTEHAESVTFWTGIPFGALFFVYVAMWIRAALKLRRAEKSGV